MGKNIRSGAGICCWTVIAGALAAADKPQPRPSGTCDHPPEFYSGAHYKIAHVRIQSPFDYLHSVRTEMLSALSAAGVQEKADFKVNAVVQGHQKIRKRLNDDAADLNLPLTVNVVVSQIENCQPGATPPALDVVYMAFVSWFPFQFARSFETRDTEASDPARAAGVVQQGSRFLPHAGYNRTARLFGGLRTTIPTPLGSFALDGFASTATVFFDATNSGQHTWDQGWIQSAEWNSGFRYSDAPTDTNRLKQARLTTQFAANSVPLGSTGAVFRFGVALGGGHDQSTFLSSVLPPASSVSNPVAELKTYAGLSLRTGRHSLKASYGFKLGQAETGARIDFAKHIAEAAYDFRFLPADHSPIELETRLNAGWIQNLGAVPAAERFFGGNADQDFLLGDSWRIRSSPFIRSIPQNRLDRLAPAAPIGGERFVSTNLTLAVTAWHRPLLPADVSNNPDFPGLLAGQLSTAEKTLKSYWISKDPSVPETLKFAGDSVAAVRDLRKQFDAVKNAVPDNLADRFSDCDLQLTLAEDFADTLDNETNVSKRFIAISSLAASDDDGSMDRLAACVTDLRAVLGAAFADPMHDRLTKVSNSIREALGRLDKNAAEAKAKRDMAFISRTVHTLVDEMNFASISPVAIFDVARIGPQSSDAGGGFRYGVGGGVRFTLLDVIRLTCGYAFNPNPKPWEGRGAAFFSMEIVSLFR